MNRKKPQIYGVVWGHVSQKSEDKVKADPEFEVAHTEQNPLLLLNIIIRVHTYEGLNATSATVNARRFYSSLRQYDYESVADFKRRFDLSIQVSESVGIERSDEAILAAEFIDKLNRGKFGALQTELHNRSLQAIDDKEVYPVSLNAAYSLASSYKSLHRTPTTGSHASHSVFTSLLRIVVVEVLMVEVLMVEELLEEVQLGVEEEVKVLHAGDATRKVM